MPASEPRESIDPIVDRFIEDYIWPRYGALGGPDEDECREIVTAVLAAQEGEHRMSWCRIGLHRWTWCQPKNGGIYRKCRRCAQVG